jgi:hypothetical protein
MAFWAEYRPSGKTAADIHLDIDDHALQSVYQPGKTARHNN